MPTPLRGIRRSIALIGVLVLVLALPGVAWADGTETLGTPSIAIADGSGIASGGTGLEDMQPASFDVVVPAGATVNQVLLYWEGFANDEFGGDDTITLDGISITGTLIGGPTRFFPGAFSSTYRADITGLGLVAAGTNTLTAGDMAFGRNDNGVGVMVIYDDGTESEIELRDGNDLAYDGGPLPPPFAPPLDTTVPQTFTFAAADVDRDVTLTLFASSVSADGDERPNSVEVTVDGVTTVFDTPFQSNVGPEFDVVELTVTVPAGATELTVQALSNDPSPSGDNPASFAWIGAGLVVPVPPPPPGGGEGCTPGYWKQDHHLDSWDATGFDPDDLYETVFGVDAGESWTLLGALEAKGGGENALARHATAALLNASNPDVSYEYTADEVIALVQSAYASGDFEGVKDLFEEQNELGCPLN